MCRNSRKLPNRFRETPWCHPVVHLMSVNSSQFGTNHRQDIMKNMVIPGISVDTIFFVALQTFSEINIGQWIITSSPRSSQSEVMAFSLDTDQKLFNLLSHRRCPHFCRFDRFIFSMTFS
jgi:hypothetical protein